MQAEDDSSAVLVPCTGCVNHLNKVKQIDVVIDNFNRRVGNGSIFGIGCEECIEDKGRGILLGIQHKVSDWREASRGARYCLHLKEKKVKIMFETLQIHRSHNDLL